MKRSGVTQWWWNSPAPSAGNTGLYLSRSVSAKQSSWSGNPVDYRIWRLMQCVHCTKHMSATPATWCSASMTHGQAYHKTPKLLVNGESGCVHAWRQKNIIFNSCQTKTGFFIANTLHNRLFSEPEPPTVHRGKHVVSRPFHRSCLKTNKINKSEEMRKVEYAYHFWKCADAIYPKLSKLVHACRNFSSPKLARFLRHRVE